MSIREVGWLPIDVAPAAFTRDGSSTRTTHVTVGRGATEIRAGIADLDDSQLATGASVLEGQVLQQHHAMGDAA